MQPDQQSPSVPGAQIAPEGGQALPPAPEPTQSSAPHPSPESSQEDIPLTTDMDGVITWTASEYIAHDKTALWYVGLVGTVSVVAAGIFFLTRSWFSSTMILLLGVAVWVYGARPPRTLRYSVGDQGIQIADKPYPYEAFRSFAVLDDGGLHGVSFMPLKRLMPVLTIYFAPDDAPRIIDVLQDYLPVEEAHNDMLDQLAHRFRF